MVNLNADGSLSYTPPANASGQASLLYTVADGFGNQDSAVISITVNNVDDAPNARNDDLGSILEDSGTFTTPASALLANDDAGAGDDSDSIRVVSVHSAVHGVISLDDNGTPETDDDSVRITAFDNYFGAAGFEYTIEDDAGEKAVASATVAVAPVNDPPTFSLGEDQNFNAGTSGIQIVDDFVFKVALGINEESRMIQTITASVVDDPAGAVDYVNIDNNG